MGVFVVGMHRSGTSALAAALEALGLYVGAPERLMAADAANPAGYYELREIGDLNDEILVAAGGGWDCPPKLADGWELEPAMTPYFRRAASIVGVRLKKTGWLIKDPRITLLLPLWRRSVLDRCAAVLIVRDPMEVAWSLALRNGMPILTGLALWSDYNRTALAGLSGLPVHVCAYNDLVADPMTTLTSISASLVKWNELPESFDLEVAAARVRPELRRTTWPRDNAESIEVPSEIERLAKFLTDLTGAHDVFEPGHPPPSRWEQAVLAERRVGILRLRTMTAEAETASKQRDESATEAEALGHRLHEKNLEFDAVLQKAQAEQTRLDAEHARLGTEQAKLGAERTRLGNLVDAVRARLAEVEAALALEQERRIRAGIDAEAVRARLAQVETDLTDVQTRRRDAEKELRNTTKRLEALERSLPVRVTRRTKALGRKIVRRFR